MVEATPQPVAAAEATKKKRVTVLFSGRGSNMATLIAASMAPDFPAIITHAITNVPDAGGLEIAKKHNVPCMVIDHKEYDSREAHEEAMAKELERERPDLIVLAGYMRIFSENFIRKFPGRILNIHPSLLPSFKGMDTHHRARVEGVRIHGASVHFVDETLDGGPIVAQAAVPVLPDDTDETLAERVLKAEHILYPKALALVASNKVRFSAGRAVVSPDLETSGLPLLISPDLQESAKTSGKS